MAQPLYLRNYLPKEGRIAILAWLKTLHPLWEQRYGQANPPPGGEPQRQLLRPVYWLGAWQFACLNYYHPPTGTKHRCVEAEPYPPVLTTLLQRIEKLAVRHFPKSEVPTGWKLNTCLVNFYGSRIEGGRRIDCARVGEHRDYEPGPVASLSLGEKALFQFVETAGRDRQSRVVWQEWLEDGSLQIFGGKRWKETLFHRIQRVEKKGKMHFSIPVESFETRRINFTFRYVPKEHIYSFAQLPKPYAADIRPYIAQLAESSPFFDRVLNVGRPNATCVE